MSVDAGGEGQAGVTSSCGNRGVPGSGSAVPGASLGTHKPAPTRPAPARPAPARPTMSPLGPMEVLNMRLKAKGGLMPLPVPGARTSYSCGVEVGAVRVRVRGAVGGGRWWAGGEMMQGAS